MIAPSMRTVAFIDAGQFRPNIIASRLDLSNGKRFDWQKFKTFLQDKAGGGLIDVHFFDSLDETTIERQGSFHQFLRNELGFQLHFTELKEKKRECPKCAHSWDEVEQKGVDVSMTVSVMKLAYSNAYDQALLCTGDGDFAPLVEFIRNSLGKRVVVIGWWNGVSPSLRDAAWETLTLNEFRDQLVGDRDR